MTAWGKAGTLVCDSLAGGICPFFYKVAGTLREQDAGGCTNRVGLYSFIVPHFGTLSITATLQGRSGHRSGSAFFCRKRV